jgi:hypothetical protein
LLPLVILATFATVIASQAVITGAFSMSRQAIRLGLLPRLQVVRTSAKGYGQIYLPAANWLLMVVTRGPRDQLRKLEQSRCSLWNSGFGDDAGNYHSPVDRDARDLELAAACGDHDRHRVCHDGWGIPVRQHDEDRPGGVPLLLGALICCVMLT